MYLKSMLRRVFSSSRWILTSQYCRKVLAEFTHRDVDIADGVQIGRGVFFETTRSLPGKSSITIGKDCELEPYVRLEARGGRIVLSRNVFLGPYTVVYGQGGVQIGDNTLLSMHCRILSSNHTIPEIGTLIRSQPDILLPTKIGSDVWLGAGVTVLGGVTIGDGCVVGAGAVVTKDIPAGAIAYGVPSSIRAWRTGSRETRNDSAAETMS
jgi:acetyltransferase-like isoleucine patch superfamily enzyme